VLGGELILPLFFLPFNDEISATSACPACMSEISLILPHTGQEESQYWEWAYEIKPYLPSYFAEEFKRAAKDLKRYGDSAKNDVESQKNTTTKGSTSKCSIL
jgi:hypothetical protein